MDLFVNPVPSYGRNYDLVPTYIEDNAAYLHLQTGKPLDQCRDFVKRTVGPGGAHPLRFPDTMVLTKNKHGDREIRQLPFNEYLADVQQKRQILSPTMAAYVHPDENMSLLAKYISGNLQLRKQAKHAMFAADMRGDKLEEAVQDAMQSTYKIKNNSLSGAHCSPYTFLWNKSSHSTLTSTCRTATSYGNANNEKFLYGNRHYYAPDIVKTNFISIINHTDLVKMEQVMAKFSLQHPTVEQVMAMVERCTSAYWRNPDQFALIGKLVSNMSAVQRSAVMFTSDFYHLAQVNPVFVRTLLTQLSFKITDPLAPEETDEWIRGMDDNMVAYVSVLCAEELDGMSLADLRKKVKETGDPIAAVRLGKIAATAKNIMTRLTSYEDFIRVFWVSDNLPSSVYYLPNILRRGAVTSDTDSTIFTVQYWTEWYVGKLDFSPTSTAIATTMVYLSAQLIRHILATFSGNMGAAHQDITRLSMKNEYYFPIFTLTSRAKHYYAYIAAREGNVYKKMKTEIKGVALRNSAVPVEITQAAHAMICDVMDTVMKGDKISIVKILGEVARLEQGIRDSVTSGSYDMMHRMQIKGPDAYKNAEQSNYVHYGLWQEVFAEKYGPAPDPPYAAIKVSIRADNRTKLNEWLATIEDPAIRDKMTAWLKKTGRTTISQLLLPETVLAMHGVPKEVISGVDIRGMIFRMMEAFYLILESLGIYMKNPNITRLVSDQGWLLEAQK